MNTPALIFEIMLRCRYLPNSDQAHTAAAPRLRGRKSEEEEKEDKEEEQKEQKEGEEREEGR